MTPTSSGRSAALFVFALALVLRVGLFPFAENKHGDASMRALIAERLVLEPASAAIPRTYCQFGPLHTTLMRPFIALDSYAPRSSRYLSLLCGLAVFFPFLAFARRLIGEARAPLAAFALAVSPSHLQASTTASSEALYLLLWVAALERLLAALESRKLGTFAVAGLLASLAAVTRYDAWLALPMVALAAWWFARKPAPATRGLAVFMLAAAIFPIAWLAWGAASGGDPLFFAHYISSDHAGLGATAAARYGPWLGRARQLGVWSLAFVAAMTPVGAVLAVFALPALKRGARSLSPAMRLAVVAALGPPAIYLAEGLIAQSFEPLARFALIPGVLLLPLAVSAVPIERARAFQAGAFASAAAFSVVVWLVATVGRERIWAGAESMGALTRLDGEDRALAAHLRAVRRPGERIMIEPFSFAEIGIAHAAGIPWTESVTLIVTRAPRATARESLLSTGAEYLVGYDRPGGWPARLPDWPRGGARFGHWIVIGRGTPGAI
ncbi:MAG TPA: glycosyltransferase family 39 protein [Polyangia bacterium]|nr:glycosyltransferase family 39 protein [Polyangia bacterium]